MILSLDHLVDSNMKWRHYIEIFLVKLFLQNSIKELLERK